MPIESINRRIGGDHGLIFVVVIYMKIPAKGGPMHGPTINADKAPIMNIPNGFSVFNFELILLDQFWTILGI